MKVIDDNFKFGLCLTNYGSNQFFIIWKEEYRELGKAPKSFSLFFFLAITNGVLENQTHRLQL
jgi:hypothetical protein